MPFRLVPPLWGPRLRIRSVPCSMRFTGRPRPIPGDGSMRCETRSSAETSCGGRGSRCAATTAHRASTRPRWPRSRSTGWPGCSTSWPSNCGRAGIGRCRRVGCSSRSRARPSSGRCRFPTVRDRIVQAAVKIVLEPIFEADLLPCSFGFRPRRSAHDALQVLIDEAWRGRRWVVETDIANCFAAIPHDKLMQAVEERVCDQAVLKLLRAMLRAGVMERRRGSSGGDRHPAGRGGLPAVVQRVPAPDRPGVGCTRARGAGAVRRRRGGDVSYRASRPRPPWSG